MSFFMLCHSTGTVQPKRLGGLADSTPLSSFFFVRLYTYWPFVAMPAAAAAAWALAASKAFWSA